jgi:hypothetical protein
MFPVDVVDRTEALIKLKELVSAPIVPQAKVRADSHSQCMSKLSVMRGVRHEFETTFEVCSAGAGSSVGLAAMDVILKRVLVSNGGEKEEDERYREILLLFRSAIRDTLNAAVAESALKALVVCLEIEIASLTATLAATASELKDTKYVAAEVARLMVENNRLTSTLARIEASSVSRCCVPLAKRLLLNHRSFEASASSQLSSEALHAILRTARVECRPFASLAIDVLTRQFFDGDRYSAEDALSQGFDNRLIRTLCGACVLNSFIPHPVIHSGLNLLERLSRSASDVSVGLVVLRIGEAIDREDEGVVREVLKVLVEGRDELKLWADVIQIRMTEDPILNLFMVNLLRRDKTNAGYLKDGLKASKLHWLDSIWESSLVDDEGVVDLTRVTALMTEHASVGVLNLVLPVCEVLKIQRMHEFKDVAASLKEHLSVSGGHVKVQDIMRTLKGATEEQAVLILDTIAEIQDCARLEKGVITEELFITALMIVNIE